MDDASFVCRRQAIGDLHGHLNRFPRRQWPTAQPLAQGFPFQQLGYNVGDSFQSADVVDGKDVGMIQCGAGTGFLLEAAKTVGISSKSRRQEFDSHVARQAIIASAIDLAHAAGADGGDDFVRAEAGFGSYRHKTGIRPPGLSGCAPPAPSSCARWASRT